jgi:DNA-binding transcriptional LysR family regulator
LGLRHIKIAQTTADMRLVDGYLSQDTAQEVRLNIPHWLAAPAVVESTDLVTAISRRMAAIVNIDDRFAVRPLPMGPREFFWRIYWHSRYDADPAHTWMRDLVRRACLPLR